MSKYEKEFKEEAIRLCKVKDSNKAEIARKLGVEYKTLCNWVYASENDLPSEEKAEMKRLIPNCNQSPTIIHSNPAID